MTVDEARRYHGHQVAVFADTECDLVSACTLTYAAEGLGIALAAREHEIPAMIYFTLDTNGRLPDGSRLGDAIAEIDKATEGYVAYYGINCAHPDHIARARDESDDLDAGNPEELADGYQRLIKTFTHASVFGGCCGTGVRHIRTIATAVGSRSG